MRLLALALGLALLMPADAALAHPAFEGAVGFYGGLLHPLLVPAHALAVTVTGLLGARQAPRWPVPACYTGQPMDRLVFPGAIPLSRSS